MPDIVDIAVSNDNFQTLVAAVKAADSPKFLENLTIFGVSKKFLVGQKFRF